MTQEPIEFSLDAYNELVLAKATHVVQTRDGRPVRVLCTDSKNGSYPIIDLIEFEGDECVSTHTLTGHFSAGGLSHIKDLFIVPKPPVSLGWVAIAQSQMGTNFCIDTRPTQQDLLDYAASHSYTLLSEPIEIFAKP